MSYAEMPWKVMASWLIEDYQCPASETREFAELEEMTSIKEHALDLQLPPRKESRREVFAVVSAGNDGIYLAKNRDARKCLKDERFQQVLVGSKDRISETVAPHSNFGSCVDVYAPGVDIVVGAAGGFFTPALGTSFSAPLVVRWITENLDRQTSAKDMRSKVLSLANSGGIIPKDQFPEELQFGRRSLQPQGRAFGLRNAEPEAKESLTHAMARARKARLLRRSLGL